MLLFFSNQATPPVNTVAPVASGTGEVGETLSCTTGTWTGTPTITYAYQWRRDTVNIDGATSSTYSLVSADAETDVDCVVTASNAAGSASQDSNDITVAAEASGVVLESFEDDPVFVDSQFQADLLWTDSSSGDPITVSRSGSNATEGSFSWRIQYADTGQLPFIGAALPDMSSYDAVSIDVTSADLDAADIIVFQVYDLFDVYEIYSTAGQTGSFNIEIDISSSTHKDTMTFNMHVYDEATFTGITSAVDIYVDNLEGV